MTDVTYQAHPDGAERSYAASAAVGDLVFACGQVPVADDGSVAPTIADQVRQALDNLERVLVDGGSSLDRLLKVTVFLADLDEFDEYDGAYRSRLAGLPLPPRTTVEVARFRGDKRVEVDAVAALV